MRARSTAKAAFLLLSATVLILIPPLTSRVSAWWADGHMLIAEAAVRALPNDMPSFFRRSAEDIAYYSLNGDLWCERSVPALRAAERHNHFIDLELLRGAEIPKTRPEYAALCARMDLTPEQAGTLPHAIQEWYCRLVIAFAKHRGEPDDERAKVEVLYTAGVLSHYTADTANPLHTTVHYDGRVPPGGESSRSGIHSKSDALPERVGLTAGEMERGMRVSGPEDVFEYVVAAIRESHGRVDAIYDLEAKLPRATGKRPLEPDAEVREFAVDCCRAGVRLTATLWYSAWLESEKTRLPGWWRRAAVLQRRWQNGWCRTRYRVES